ncbi:MAG: glycosyltransferase family 2 protein [Pleomorphochaeta sp.]
MILQNLSGDDGSDDNTESVIEAMSSQDVRVRYLKNNHLKEPASARNAGIVKSKGSYIAFLDGDDEWLPDHLEESLQAIKLFKTKVCFSLWCERTADGAELVRYKSPKDRELFQCHIKATNPEKNGQFYKFDMSFFNMQLRITFIFTI